MYCRNKNLWLRNKLEIKLNFKNIRTENIE